jgi:uracil-DNA glycosylase
MSAAAAKSPELRDLIPPNWHTIFAKIVAMPQWTMLEFHYKFECDRHGEEYIFPPKSAIFHAFELIDPCDIRVVIIGQDPYHQPG